MQDASPAQWERMARLYKACLQDSSTELCEAAEAVRTLAPPTQEQKAVPPIRPPSRSRVGQQAQ